MSVTDDGSSEEGTTYGSSSHASSLPLPLPLPLRVAAGGGGAGGGAAGIVEQVDAVGDVVGEMLTLGTGALARAYRAAYQARRSVGGADVC